MKLTAAQRSLTAWMLYASVLFSLLFCGIHHGQMSALALSGLDSGYCWSSGNDIRSSASEDARPQGSLDTGGPWVCPLCSAAVVCLVLLIGLTWLRAASRRQAYPGEPRCKAPPRYSWPAANPRASPL
ncbi:DUF2946 domain-containing protein [Pseudomonas sp. 21LCFQ010]|uniref:DUF2946 domain-containing protein n=1 Tax=Pseudomonas sp. 21LCFQ010 TaxID=2957506 RepID=UPI0020976841|nr:DUF2946 domain-containing protein [Pseudomonas sp. 21LCFQ010]MCO8166021.1 DUF2946 domain-containing protein [Pseudomonas sp. 21LCFQ010]